MFIAQRYWGQFLRGSWRAVTDGGRGTGHYDLFQSTGQQETSRKVWKRVNQNLVYRNWPWKVVNPGSKQFYVLLFDWDKFYLSPWCLSHFVLRFLPSLWAWALCACFRSKRRQHSSESVRAASVMWEKKSLHENAQKKACGLFWVNGSWFLWVFQTHLRKERNSVTLLCT